MGKIKEGKYRREQLRKIEDILKQEGATGVDVMFKRQLEEEDEFAGLYGELNLAVPPYSFSKLYQIYEGSDVLQACVDVMVQNIDGFGYKLQFLGDDIKDKELPEAVRQNTSLSNFFDYANDEESWTTIRKLMRKDYEVLGNAGFEIIRNKRGEVALSYYIPFENMRISATPGRPITIPVTVMRDGRLVTLKVKKYFRKFIQLNNYGKRKRWFKSFGDPRVMDAVDGEYRASPKIPASEIWLHKNQFSNEVYGLPRFIGAVLQSIGRRSAAFVNYDLFENQGIPPMVVLVTNGVLTDDSIAELEDMIRGMRGVQKWNRVMILEANVAGVGLEEKGSAKMELKSLAEARQQDMMFTDYMKSSADDIRHIYRLPPLYVGMAETFTHATAKAAQTVAEEQVFVSERSENDEKFNMVMVQKELKCDLWKYVTRGPRIVGSQEISKGIETFSKVGAISINHAIERANEAFGLDMSKFDEPWADYPFPLVLELLKSGKLTEGLDKLSSNLLDDATKLLPAPVAKQQLLPGITEKALKDDLFNDTEIALYKMLTGLQGAITQINKCDHDHDM